MTGQISSERLTDQKLIEWYCQCTDIMKRNIKLYQKEIDKINEQLDFIERKGELHGFKFPITKRKELRDFAINILYTDHKNECLLNIYEHRISKLKRLLTICHAFRSGNEYKDPKIEIDSFRGVSVRSILDRYNVQVKDRFANCPIHGEKTPSFCIYESTNSWYCFGCHKGGNPIDLIMYLEKKSFKDIIPILQTLV